MDGVEGSEPHDGIAFKMTNGGEKLEVQVVVGR